MPRIFSSLLSFGILFFGSIEPCLGNSDPELKMIRDIATALLKQKGGGTPAAYCALTSMRPTNSCSGNDRLEDSLVAHQNGTLEWIRFRSFAEGPDPRPGQFRGGFSPEKWKALLRALSKMDWIKPRYQMPPPGHSETHTQITLSDGKRTSKFSISGTGPRGQDLISDGFDQMSILGQSATDTLWALSLEPLSSTVKNGILTVQARWSVRGANKVSLSHAANPTDATCGSTSLNWFYDRPETPGITPLPVEFQYSQSIAGPRTSDHWAKVDSNTPAMVNFRFQLPEKMKKEPKAGKLAQLGVLVKTSESAAPINVSLYSGTFSF